MPLTLLKFYADWCKPCQNMASIVERLDAEDDLLIVQNVNIDNEPNVRQEYNIRSIPAFVLVKDRKEIARKVGSGTYSEMKEFIRVSRDL